MHPRAGPVVSSQLSQQSEERAQKNTLHAFWNIKSPPEPPSVIPMAVDSTPELEAGLKMRCEDCDGSLRQEDAMDLDDGMVEQETMCHCCKRQVCDRCAVLGNARVCLGCATSRR